MDKTRTVPKKARGEPPQRRGGCLKTTRAGPHRTPCRLRRRGRMGHGALWKRFFGALDGLSRRTLVLLPPGAERPSETPLFDSTPPADAAMVVAAVSRRPVRSHSGRPWHGFPTSGNHSVPRSANRCVTPRRPRDAENRRSTGNCEDWSSRAATICKRRRSNGFEESATMLAGGQAVAT